MLIAESSLKLNVNNHDFLVNNSSYNTMVFKLIIKTDNSREKTYFVYEKPSFR